MNKETRLFGSLRELPEKIRGDFQDFNDFNSFIERNPLIRYIDIFKSYIKVVSDIGQNPNFLEYSELDFQIKKLIDEIKVPINRVLKYAEIKLGDYKQIFENFFMQIPGFDDEKRNNLLNEICKVRKGTLTIVVTYKDNNRKEKINIEFDIDGDIRELNNRLKDLLGKIVVLN